jgi:hypothetical protein
MGVHHYLNTAYKLLLCIVSQKFNKKIFFRSVSWVYLFMYSLFQAFYGVDGQVAGMLAYAHAV